jgi:membrane-associated phospholipid phosphatase
VRASEWVYIGYFCYVTLIALLLRPAIALGAALVAGGMALLVWLVASLARKTELFSTARDWAPLLYTLLAYREMNWFTPLARDYHLELSWIAWDRTLLVEWGLRGAIESLGPLIPGYLELCYVLVYATGAVSIGTFYLLDRRERIDHFLVAYATGTLLSYAMFPFFPSDPPRVVFPGADLPGIVTPIRDFNLFLVGNYGIHSSVFPSAHVSSAFAAAWGMLWFLPEKRWAGWAMLVYAVSVSIATIYGRYHYATDALAGAAVGLSALAVAFVVRRQARPAGVALQRSMSR